MTSETERVIDYIEKLMSREEPKVLDISSDTLYTVATTSGSVYTYDTKNGTVTGKSKSVGEFTARGHFIGADDLRGIYPGKLVEGSRVGLLVENEKTGKFQYISTSAALDIKTTSL